jgi:hypothetical protein
VQHAKRFNALVLLFFFSEKSFELIKLLGGWRKGKPSGSSGNNHLIIFHCVKTAKQKKKKSRRDIRAAEKKRNFSPTWIFIDFICHTQYGSPINRHRGGLHMGRKRLSHLHTLSDIAPSPRSRLIHRLRRQAEPERAEKRANNYVLLLVGSE